jgi:AraC family transcriptional regulator, ethanolamine operon transcriptional activator
MERLTFQSFDEYAAAVQHADIRLTLSNRQHTNWVLDYLSLGDMSVHWGQDAGPNVVEGSSSPGGLTLFVPLYNADAVVGNGSRMDEGSVMVLEPGSEFCIASIKVNRWSSIFVPHGLLKNFGISEETSKRTHSVLSPTESGKKLRSLIESLGDAARALPDHFWSTPAARIVKGKLAESVAAVLCCQDEISPLPGRRILSRPEIIQTALRILDEYTYEHLSVQRLAGRVGISERTLRTAFEEYFGVPPARYLKLRTLHRARSILKWSDPNAISVTEIAVGLGVWELGRFSHDYRVLFNELPSETLRHS